jgi:N-acetylglucosamine repressor
VKSGQNPASIRVNNRQLVLDFLRSASRELTVPQISQAIDLSRTTLWKIMEHFVSSGLVVNTGKADSSDDGGKKAELYALNEYYGYVIAISTISTSIELALTDMYCRVFYREVVHIQEEEPFERVVSIIAQLVKTGQEPRFSGRRAGARLLGISLAQSGVVNTSTGEIITASRFQTWPMNAPLKTSIEQQVEFRAPVFIDNYNRFQAFAEKSLGVGRDKRNIIAVIAGHDGLGAGIIAENAIKRGPQYLTGEIGHTCINPADDELCHCGGRGCFEQQVSNERLLRKAEAGRTSNPESSLYRDDKPTVELQDIFDAANDEDLWARELLDEVVRWFAIGLHNTVLVFNPEIIVISGDYRYAGPYFLHRVREEMRKVSLIRMNKDVEVCYSMFDWEGPIIGGASYVLTDFFRNRLQY